MLDLPSKRSAGHRDAFVHQTLNASPSMEEAMSILGETEFSVHAAKAATMAAIVTARIQGRLTVVYASRQASRELPVQGVFDALH
jgi:hypothetical protein